LEYSIGTVIQGCRRHRHPDSQRTQRTKTKTDGQRRRLYLGAVRNGENQRPRKKKDVKLKSNVNAKKNHFRKNEDQAQRRKKAVYIKRNTSVRRKHAEQVPPKIDSVKRGDKQVRREKQKVVGKNHASQVRKKRGTARSVVKKQVQKVLKKIIVKIVSVRKNQAEGNDDKEVRGKRSIEDQVLEEKSEEQVSMREGVVNADRVNREEVSKKSVVNAELREG